MTMLVHGLIVLLNIGAPQPTCSIAAELKTSIERYTSYPMPEECPTVLRMDLRARFAGAVQAAEYFPETNEIALAPDIDLNTAIGRGYLLHEMVHAAQFAAGQNENVSCLGLLEAEAYQVQAAYLRQQGERQEATLMLLMSAFAGVCTDPNYGTGQ